MIKNEIRKYLLLFILLIIVDTSIIIGIPVFRQILGFLFFTIVPGWLILDIMKVREIESLKRILLSVGLSIAFIMFGGLLVNSLYPFVPKPLSLNSLLITLNIILLFLISGAYWKNRSGFHTKNVFNWHVDLQGKLIFPLLFPFLFPLLSIFGAFLMNTKQNNIITLVMLGLIPVYLIIIVLFNKKISNITYPIAIGMIGLSLLLMYSLTSNHIIGYADPDMQLYVFKLTANNAHWDISNFFGGYNACLSSTILPTVYYNLLNISEEYIFKVVFQLLFCITPVVIYLLFKKYIGEFYAFLSSFLFIAQIPFIWNMPVQPRVAVALIFFALAIFVLFDKGLSKQNKLILFLLFAFSVIVSHYSTTYIFVFLLLGGWLISSIFGKLSRNPLSENVLSLTVIALLFCLIFLWQSQVTGISFIDTIRFFSGFAQNIKNIFLFEMSGANALKTLGIGLSDTSQYISVIVHDITFAIVTIGVFSMVARGNKYKFEREYVYMAVLGELLLVFQIVVPYLSIGYDTIRLYLTVLIIMAPAFVIGVNTIVQIITNWIKDDRLIIKFNHGLITVILVSLFLCVTSIIYLIFGNPGLAAEPLTLKSAQRGAFYIYDQEVSSARWLKKYSASGSSVYADFTADSRFIVADWEINSSNIILFTKQMYDNKMSYAMLQYSAPPTISDKTAYVYLRRQNIVDNKVSTDLQGDTLNLNEISGVLIMKNRIYTNDGSEIYK